MALPSGEWDALWAIGRTVRFDAGDVLLREGDTDDALLLVTAGRVKVTRTTHRGPGAVLGFRGAGTVLGEVAAITGRPRTVTVEAVEAVRASSVSGAAFRRHIRERPELATALLDQLANWLHDADTRHRDQTTGDATARVSARLLDLAEQWGVDDGGHRRLTLPLTQDELAGYAGASLESTARALRVLRRAGWLTTGRREIVITDPAALRRRAAS